MTHCSRPEQWPASPRIASSRRSSGRSETLPGTVRLSDETLRDHVDLTAAEFYERLRTTSVQPATSQPTPGDFQEAFEALAEFERIVCITVSAKLSGTYESARLAAEAIGA